MIFEIENSLLFSSKRFDESIGLSYFGARCYDAFIGRFISRDPEEYLDGPNQYVLTKNNPLLWFDPFGLCKRFLPMNHATVAESLVGASSGSVSLGFTDYHSKNYTDYALMPKDNPNTIGASLAFNSISVTYDEEQLSLTWSLTTDLIGIGAKAIDVSNGDGDPLHIGLGMSKWQSIEVSGFSNLSKKGTLSYNVGFGYSALNLVNAPVSVSYDILSVTFGKESTKPLPSSLINIDSRR